MTNSHPPRGRLDGLSRSLLVGSSAAGLLAAILAGAASSWIVAILALSAPMAAIAAVLRIRRAGARALRGAGQQIDRDRGSLAAAREASERSSTERSEMETRVADLEERLLSAQKMELVGQMTAGVVHEFNNMLTVVQVEGAFAREELAHGSPAAAHVDQILAATARAAELSSRLMLFGRRRSRTKRPTHVDAEIRNLEPLLVHLAGEQHRVVLQLHAENAHVLADGNQVEQLLTNLVANARDAMPGGGRTVIRTGLRFAEDGLQVRVDVQDEGQGMDETTRARLFQPPWTGLGHATVYAIVGNLEGSIEVQSESGVGTVFSLFLPVAMAALTETPKPAATPPPIRERTSPEGDVRWSILLAEDQDPVRDAVARALESLGCLVVRVRTPRDVLRQLDKGADRFDLLLADVIMPGLTGIELAESVRVRAPGLQVLLMSGHASDEAVLDRLARMDVPVLHKPFTPEELIRAVYARLEERGLPPASSRSPSSR